MCTSYGHVDIMNRLCCIVLLKLIFIKEALKYYSSVSISALGVLGNGYGLI